MTPDEAAARSRQWLEEQLEQLRDLRNANPRDPGFKLWRQSTLTVIQRIWAGDGTRMQRFRSIRFHAPGTRNDGKTTREWYERGCAEATQMVRALLDDIEENGVPDPREIERMQAALPGTGEDDFPTVDLDLGESDQKRAANRNAIPETTDIILDLGGPAASDSDANDRTARDAGSPAPPTLRVDVPKTSGRSGGSGTRAKSSNGGTRATKPAKKSAPKTRLREMLGFDALGSTAKPESGGRAPQPPAPSPAAAAKPAPPPPAAAKSAPPPEAPPRPSAKRQPKRVVSIESLISPEFRLPHPPAQAPPPVAQAPPAPEEPAPVEPVAPPPSIEFVPIGELISQAPVEPIETTPVIATVEPPPVAAHFELPPAAPPAPEAMPERHADEHDPETLERATREFISNSPVLSLQGRPVQRLSDATSHQHPDAVALATLAQDVGRLGIPEGRRAGVRATLIDLSRRMDSADVDWPVLRDTTTFAMDYPELAKRLLPILLPWFERAA